MGPADEKTGGKHRKKPELAFCLLLGLGTALILKYYYGNAGSDQLLWILAPTAWWTRILGGIAFTYEPGVGYINHTLQFIIAPSCAGVRFLSISLMMLTASFAGRKQTLREGIFWIAESMGIVWMYTCLVNGVRMVLSVKLPPVLEAAGIGGTWLTWERLHTIIGTAVYFPALLLLYRLGERLAGGTWKTMQENSIWKPVLWYILPVLAIPLLNRILRQDYTGFAEYACLVGGVCFALLSILCIGIRHIPHSSR